MGYDVVGLKPNLNESELQDLKTDYRYLETEDPIKNALYGICFSNNISWWPSLWNFVCQIGKDILSNEQMKNGYYNDGIEITKEQCQMLSKIITEQLDSGNVKQWEIDFNEYMSSIQNTDHFAEDNVRLFNEFLKRCGGFRIW
jgi:hypothetical protein